MTRDFFFGRGVIRLRKLLLWLVLWITLLLAVLYFLLKEVAVLENKGNIRVGVLYPLTGNVSSWGIAAKEGVELAAAEINKAGGINGKKIELIVEDSQCDPVKGVSAMIKLVNVDRVKYVIGDICSSVIVPVAPIAEANKVVVIAQGSSPDITGLGDYIFRNWPSDAYQGKLMAEYTYQRLGLKRVAVLNVENPYGKGLADAFETRFKELGGEVAVRESYLHGNRDFRSILLRIKARDVEGLYFVTELEDAFVAKQSKELGLQVQLIGADTLATKEVYDIAGDALDGAIYSFPSFSETNELVSTFNKKFKQFFGKESGLNNVSAHGYDAVRILALALDGVAYEEVDMVKNRLYKIRGFQGVSGLTTFDENGDVIKPFSIYKIEKGNPILLFSQ